MEENKSVSEPLVSIIIPTYNRAHLIGETIQSVFDQTYKNWELIIVDDGSSDQTEMLIKKYNDGRIQYFAVKHSGVFGKVRNHGISRSKGEFIAFLDSDDVWQPEKLRIQVSHLQNSSALYVFTHIELFGNSDVILPDYPSIESAKLLSLYLEERHFSFYPSTLMFKRSALSITGLMNETLPTGSDTDFFLKLCCHFSGTFLSKRLTRIRKHNQNTSSSDVLFSYHETIALIRDLYKKGYLPADIYRITASKLYYKMGLILNRCGQYISSFKCFLQYCYFKPVDWKGWARLLQIPLLYISGFSKRSFSNK